MTEVDIIEALAEQGVYNPHCTSSGIGVTIRIGPSQFRIPYSKNKATLLFAMDKAIRKDMDVWVGALLKM